MVAEARIVDPGQTGDDPDGTVIEILDGNLALDASANVRSTVDLTTNGVRMWNKSPAGLINPYGPELWVRRGVQYGNGAREWVSLGYHRIYSVGQDVAPDGPLRLDARDRMSGLIDARMLAPRQFTAAASVESLVTSLVHEVMPTAVIEYDFEPHDVKLNRAVVVEEDRYAALLDVVQSLGKVCYWDHAGKLQIRTPPNPLTPVYEVDSGRGGVMVKLSRTMSRDGMFNAVVAQGEAPDNKPPARGYARDMNPKSPTYYDGPFGRVPRYYRSPLITSPQQATQAARTLLTNALGLPHSADFSAIPNPALEALDPVRIRHRDGSEVHVIETLNVPLVANATLDGTTRDLTAVEIDDGELA